MIKYNFGSTPLETVDDLFGDKIAFVKYYDFSRANSTIFSRIHAVTSIASVCYANPKAVDKESLFNRLASESKGLPSSSFEFIPMLIPFEKIKKDLEEYKQKTNLKEDIPLDIFNIFIFGKRLEAFIDGQWVGYLLTNYRAVLSDSENCILDYTEYYNTKEVEFEIIKANYHVFNAKIDIPTRTQLIRHRTTNLQELSRRYVSGKKIAFDFYIEDKIKDIKITLNMAENKEHYQPFEIGAEDVLDICVQFYDKLIESGIKAESARRFIPQGVYSEIWVGINNWSLDNFLTLRLDSHAQKEIRLLAQRVRDMCNSHYTSKIEFREPSLK